MRNKGAPTKDSGTGAAKSLSCCEKNYNKPKMKEKFSDCTLGV